jgi:lambda repressor-like predicted transcriptional regulator
LVDKTIILVVGLAHLTNFLKKESEMTPFEIKIALMKEGVSMRSLARKLGVSVNAISLVVNRRMVSRRIMDEISRAIKLDRAAVFSR